MAPPPITPAEITAAVQQLITEIRAQQTVISDSRQRDLTELYGMINSLIKGQGFVSIEELGKDRLNVESGQNNDGLAQFLEEYLLDEGIDPKHIKLPVLSHMKLDLVYPAPKSPSPEVIAKADSPELTLPTSATLPIPTMEERTGSVVSMPMDIMQVEQTPTAYETKPLDPDIPIPNFNIPTTYQDSQLYVPRAVINMIKEDQAPEDDPTWSNSDKGKQKSQAWLGQLPNLSAFQPAYHPLLFPPAGTGLILGQEDESMNPTLSPFGVPLSQSIPRIPSEQAAKEMRQERIDGLIPLESAYAASLHPLPSGLASGLSKKAHRHHHHHHRRDRRRSSVSGPADGAPATAATNQNSKLASSMMIPGASSYALPPAYASRRRLGVLNQDQVQAQNEQLDIQRAQNRERDEVDLVELGVTFSVNPVARMTQRNNKCMLSRDWRTVWREIQFTRALERVEQLKDEGAWSFRQMKRFRGPSGGVAKSHWDYMMDEMRWMQADFKEERRWKLVVAKELADEVVEWHQSSPSERQEIMVGNRPWGYKWQGTASDRQYDHEMDANMDEDDAEAQAVLDSLQERDREVESVEGNQGGAQPIVIGNFGDVEMADAEGEEEDGDAEVENEDEDAAGEVDDEDELIGNGEIETAGARHDEYSDMHQDIAMTGDVEEPNSGVQGETLATEEAALPIDEREVFIAAAPAIRRPLLDSDAAAVVVDLHKILDTEATTKNVVVPENVLLADLFPDLSVYSAPTVPEDKIEKRLDESAGRLAHTTRLMDIKPVIVSTIRPSMSRRVNGKWEDLGRGFLHEPEDDLEEFRFDPAQYPAPIFEGKKTRPQMDVPLNRAPEQPRNSAIRAASIIWDETDDDLLMRLIRDYAWNWRLIADLFNSARNTISTDRRNAWDCYHRWDQKWGPTSKVIAPVPATDTAGEPHLTPAQQEFQQARAQAQAIALANHAQGVPGAPPPVVTPVPASAVPTQVTASVVETADGTNGATSPGAVRREAKIAKEARYQGSKKKVRNNTMRDAIRRSVKRREINKKNNTRETVDGQQVVTIHESHTGFLAQRGAIVPSPQELSQLQAQRFIEEQEILRAKRLQEARIQQMAQHNRIQQAAQLQQHQARASQTPQSATGASQPNGTPSIANGTPVVGPAQRQPPTPGAAQQMAMQQTQMVNHALQAAAQQQAALQQSAANAANGNGPPSSANGLPQGQPRAQITGPNVITLANGTRLTVPAQGGSPGIRLQSQVQQHMAQQRAATPAANGHPVQGQPNGIAAGSPHLNGQNIQRPLSRPGQITGPGGAAIRGSNTGVRPGQATTTNGQNQAFIASLLAKAGLQSMHNIPIPPKPDGGQWSPQEIIQQQVAYLHRLATQHNQQNANAARAATPANNPANAANNANKPAGAP